MRYYPAYAIPETDEGYTGFWGKFVQNTDLPANASGKTKEELTTSLEDCLLAIVDIYFDQDRIFPEPLPVVGDQLAVKLPSIVEAKILLNNERLKRKMRKAELARLAGVTPTEMQRILNPRHGTKLDAIEQVLNALGVSFRLFVA
jgi:antitoxin HicB